VYPRDAVIVLMADVDSERIKAEADVKLEDLKDAIDSERMFRIVLEIEDDFIHS
jgi:hypothetical protein